MTRHLMISNFHKAVHELTFYVQTMYNLQTTQLKTSWMYLFLTFDYSLEEKHLENTLPHKWQQGMQKKGGKNQFNKSF